MAAEYLFLMGGSQTEDNGCPRIEEMMDVRRLSPQVEVAQVDGCPQVEVGAGV
jgi:hypothetical protein